MEIVDLVKSKVSEVQVTVDEPENPLGSWFINFNDVEVEKRGSMYGVSAPPHHYGEGADMVFDDVKQAADRVVALLRG